MRRIDAGIGAAGRCERARGKIEELAVARTVLARANSRNEVTVSREDGHFESEIRAICRKPEELSSRRHTSPRGAAGNTVILPLEGDTCAALRQGPESDVRDGGRVDR